MMEQSSKQKIGLQKSKELTRLQSFKGVSNKITTISSKDFKDQYEPTSEIFKIEVGHQNQGKRYSQLMPQPSAFNVFKKQQEQQTKFAEQHKVLNKKPLKIVKIKIMGNEFRAFYKELKKNSSFPKIIPINTIVLTINNDELLWPAIIVDFEQFLTKTNKKNFHFQVNLINTSKSFWLKRYNIIQFTPQNIKKIKEFINNKKLYKSLKIAEKMLSQLSEKKNEGLLNNTQNQIKSQQFSSKFSSQFKNLQKFKQINFIIQTTRIKPQKNILRNEDQIEKNQQILQKQLVQKQMQNQLRLLLKRVYLYLLTYRFELKNNKHKKEKFAIGKVFHLFSQPLDDFKIGDFPKYACIIDKLVQLCTQKYLNLKDQDNYFMIRSKKVLTKLYQTLKDYEGENGFINCLKMFQLSKLKDFEEMDKKNIEINH